MTRPAALRVEVPTYDLRQRVIEEMSEALERLGGDLPPPDPALTLRLAIGFLADIHARGFGHAVTVKALLAIARRGISSANEELTAPRH